MESAICEDISPSRTFRDLRSDGVVKLYPKKSPVPIHIISCKKAYHFQHFRPSHLNFNRVPQLALHFLSKKARLDVTLPETNGSHLKMGQRETIVFQPSIFRGENVSFRECNCN